MSKGLSGVKTLTANEIAKKWNLPLSVVAKKIAAGVKVEKEHTTSTRQANEIARDHLGERPDYYDKLHKMEKTKVVKEETGISGVRGLGYVSGDPGVDYVQSYIDTNAMEYEDQNGNNFKYQEKIHKKLHGKLGFKEFDPRKVKSNSNKDLAEEKHPLQANYDKYRAGKLNELGSDYGTAAVPVIGDLTGTPKKVGKVEEIKISPKVKKAAGKAARAALVGSNLMALGTAADPGSTKDPGHAVVQAATALPGPAGYGASAVHYAKKAYDYVKSRKMNEETVNEDLRKWFREKWVRYDTKGNIKGPCAREEGEGKPKCRPLASARSMSKQERAKSARRKRREDPVADRPGKGGKPVMVRTEETLMEKNVPTNPELWARAKSMARSKFDVYPSAYANGWASKWYKSKGGGWKTAANESIEEACWDTHKQEGMKKKGGKMVPNCVPKEEKNVVPASSTERGIYQEGYASIGHPYDRFGDVNRRAKFYGSKPKPTTTKNDEKDDTYKDSKQGGKVKFAKTVKEDQIDEISAELVGKVSNARFWQGKAPSKTLSNAIKKKFIESGKKKEEKKQVKEYIEPYFITSHKEGEGGIRKRLGGRMSQTIRANKPDAGLHPGAKGMLDRTIDEVVADVAPMQHMDAAKAGEYRPARASQSRVNLRGTTAHVKGAEYRSGTGSARASLGTGGQMKPTTTNVPTRFMRSVKNAPSTQGASGQLKPTSTSGSSTFTPNSQSRAMNVGKAMGASKQTSLVTKGMSAAGQEASKKIVPKAASIVATAGKIARGITGPEGAVAAAAAEPLAKKMASSYKAGHQSFTPHGSEGEKASTVFARMKQPSQGRSTAEYEKQVLTPKASEAPRPKVDAPTPPSRPEYFSRGQAFGAARGEAGGGSGKFSYDSKSYQTNVKGEPYKPESQLKQTSIKETTMDTKELINEALDNILDNNLAEMKENLQQALQEKAMEKIEERKKIIAANYFAQ